MTSPNKLEVKGNLRERPFAELLTEAAESRLDGSFRLAAKDRKAIVYLRGGEVVFAVSNAREHRLFEMLLRDGKITREQLADFPNFASDMELSQSLAEKNVLNQIQIHKLFSQQVEDIFRSVLDWHEGEWIFSPLARIKDSINYKIETQKILLEYARDLSPDKIVRRFRSFQESFAVKPNASQLDLLPLEAFFLSRFENSFLKVQEVVALGGVSEAITMKTLYSLWLGGFLFRQNYNAAFAEHKISSILSAKLALKTPEAPPETVKPEAVKTEKAAPGTAQPAAPKSENPAEEIAAKPPTEADERRRLEEYLARVEEAETFYEVLGVAPQAKTPEIKTAYFALAKNFHPDLFHKESGSETHRRVHAAFTEIARAYEVLKDEKQREVYDFKNREKIEAAKKEKAKAAPKEPADAKERQAQMAAESFAEGFDHLVNEEYEAALPLLARAVHLAPDNARYHAYLGKLLAADEKQRYKAEAELQQAIKLDASEPLYRILLAEFYIAYGLNRRAEGELQRLLKDFPDNADARALLKSLAA
jgi:Flp pilus assembly protein TadD